MEETTEDKLSAFCQIIGWVHVQRWQTGHLNYPADLALLLKTQLWKYLPTLY